jgi:hypothetical protein
MPISSKKTRKKAQISNLPDKGSMLSEFARKGGFARAKVLSPKKRTQIARQAALTRWKRKHTTKAVHKSVER